VLSVACSLLARSMQHDLDALGRAAGPRANDEQNHPGIRVPSPPFSLLPLLLGLLLDRRAHVPFLPRRVGASRVGASSGGCL
jgi:hypothetical protein